MSGSDYFNQLLDGMYGPKPKPEKGVQLRGKSIDGAFYIRAEDVVALLEINGALPKAARLIKGRL